TRMLIASFLLCLVSNFIFATNPFTSAKGKRSSTPALQINAVKLNAAPGRTGANHLLKQNQPLAKPSLNGTSSSFSGNAANRATGNATESVIDPGSKLPVMIKGIFSSVPKLQMRGTGIDKQ